MSSARDGASVPGSDPDLDRTSPTMTGAVAARIRRSSSPFSTQPPLGPM
jgi:hypothetical protein